MERDDYMRLVQREANEEVKEQALRINEHNWDVEEFMYNEKHVDGVYSYLDKFYDDNFE